MKNSLKYYAIAAEGAKLYYTDINRRDFFRNKHLCKIVQDKGAKALKEVFDERVGIVPPSCPHFSYGHLSSIGAKMNHPDGSEPNAIPMFDTIQEGVKWLKRDFNFADCDMFRHFYDTYLFLKESFPDQKVNFSYGKQGPITTAVLLRGQDFYMDIYDKPDLVHEFLDLITKSTIEFHQFLCLINNQPFINKNAGYTSDDFASLLSPEQWKSFVNPYFEKYYQATTMGERRTHVENLVPEHMHRLKELGITIFDPSVSRALSPAKIIEETPDLYFSWRLLGIDINDMSVSDVVNWVEENVKQGAPHLHTVISREYCMNDNPKKAFAFLDTCERIKKESI